MTLAYFSIPLRSGSIRRRFCADCRFLCAASISRTAFQTSLNSVEAKSCASSSEMDRRNLSKAQEIVSLASAIMLQESNYRRNEINVIVEMGDWLPEKLDEAVCRRLARLSRVDNKSGTNC